LEYQQRVLTPFLLSDTFSTFLRSVFAAEDSPDGDLLIRPQHLDEALTELVVAGGVLTHRLLGANPGERQPEKAD